jgi:hypothetical protein
MEVSRLKLLIVTLVTVLSLALGASGTIAHHDKGHRANETPAAKKCADVFFDQRDNHNGWTTNCNHRRQR